MLKFKFCSNFVLNESTFKHSGYKWFCVTNLLDTINVNAPCDAIWSVTSIHIHMVCLDQSIAHTIIWLLYMYIHMIYFFIDLELTFTQTLSCPWSGQKTVDVAIKEGGRACVVSQQNKVLPSF